MGTVNAPGHGRGFTLIEIAVVLLILVIVVATIGIELRATDRVTVRDQAKRLALLVHAMRQQAILQGEAYALGFDRDGYRFFALSPKGRWTPVQRDNMFRARQFPKGVAVSVEVNGAQRQGLVRIAPSGLVTPFNVVFTEGDARWRVTAAANGDVSADPAH